MRPAPLVLVLLVALSPTAAALPLPTDEGPTHGACDSTGLLVCAGADTGASVQCSIAFSGGDAGCQWSYGFLTTAYSPVGLPGSATEVYHATVRACSSLHGCVDAPWSSGDACSFTGPVACTHGVSGDPGQQAFTLALGECVTVTVLTEVWVNATATLASVAFHNAGSGAGAACYVDDGR
jgi:hypothetical protein